MAFVGNRTGPRKSEILSRLGPEYFGITGDELEYEIEQCRQDERDGVVDCVFVDSNSRRYLEFYAPGGAIQIFYLDEHGYALEGDVLEEYKAVSESNHGGSSKNA